MSSDLTCNHFTETRNGETYLVLQITNDLDVIISAKLTYSVRNKRKVITEKSSIVVENVEIGGSARRGTKIFSKKDGTDSYVDVTGLYIFYGPYATGVPKATEVFNQRYSASGSDSNSDCFVATACLGYRNPVVVQLQDFRDNYLLKYHFGRFFVAAYNFSGPTCAAYIVDKPILKGVVRRLLMVLVKLLPQH